MTRATPMQPPSVLRYRERQASNGKKRKIVMFRKDAGINFLNGRAFRNGY